MHINFCKTILLNTHSWRRNTKSETYRMTKRMRCFGGVQARVSTRSLFYGRSLLTFTCRSLFYYFMNVCHVNQTFRSCVILAVLLGVARTRFLRFCFKYYLIFKNCSLNTIKIPYNFVCPSVWYFKYSICSIYFNTI